MAATIMALLMVPAYSQGTSGGKKHRGQEQKTDGRKKNPDDQA
jgi:hypothetical protein